MQSVRISDYAHTSFMAGGYSPSFLDTQHGRDFLDEHADHVLSAKVRFQGTSGRVSVTLSGKACFSYSCDEDDQSYVQNLLRALIQPAAGG